MATVSELYTHLNTLLPRSLSCDWDNDGLMVCGDPNAEVKKILFTLDITMQAVEYAEKIGADLIISHHPLIFKGIKHMNGEDITSKKVIRLLQSGISAMSFHTRLDAAEGGINDILAETLELQNIEKFEAEEGLDSRFGDLKHEMTFEDFCLYVKEKLGAPSILASKGKDTVSRVAVLGGAGKDAIFSAMATGADAYLTGEANYHGLLDAAEMGFSVLTAGHDFTENAFFTYFKKVLSEKFDGLIFEENPVKCALHHF